MVGPGLLNWLGSFFAFVPAFVVMASVHWRLTVVALLPAPLVSMSVVWFGRIIHARFDTIQEAFSDTSSRVDHTVLYRAGAVGDDATPLSLAAKALQSLDQTRAWLTMLIANPEISAEHWNGGDRQAELPTHVAIHLQFGPVSVPVERGYFRHKYLA